MILEDKMFDSTILEDKIFEASLCRRNERNISIGVIVSYWKLGILEETARFYYCVVEWINVHGWKNWLGSILSSTRAQ